MIQQAFSKAREIAHSALAVFSAVSLGQGAVVTVLDAVGIHVAATTVSHDAMIAGGVLLAISKGVDSLNNALTSGALQRLGAPTPQPAAPATTPPA